jgi:hypothetical protein
VRQGELYRAGLTGPTVIGIVDGYFEAEPTVWHKEILWAMAQRIHVFGSASIGALRAAELHAFGMLGVGRVFEAFRDGILEDDDEVAVLHGPAELGYPSVTEAMVNIRATVEAAIADLAIDRVAAQLLIETAKTLFYKERAYDTILRVAAGRGMPAGAVEAFAKWLPRGRVDRKRLDALAMIDAIRARLAAGVPPLPVGYTLAESAAWRAARKRAEQETDACAISGRRPVP